MFLFYVKWLPLIFTSIISKIGVIMVIFQYFGIFYALIMLLGIFVINFFSSLIVRDLPVFSKPKNSAYTINKIDTLQEKQLALGSREKIFLSYSNMFIISGPLEETR